MIDKILVGFGVAGLVAFLIALFLGGPVLSILAVNQLFGTSIAVTVWNWLAAFWLHIVVASVATRNKKD